MPDSITKKMKALRERAGLSMDKLAKALGYKTASSYQRYETDLVFKGEFLPLPLVRKLVQILPGKGSPPITEEEVLMLAGLRDITGNHLQSLDHQKWIWCIGEVAAGSWREAFEWPRDEWRPVALAVEDGRYPGAERRALLVRGDSMDLVYPDGSYVIFVALEAIGRRPQNGDRVVVVRQQHGQVEATVKEYRRAAGERWLLPRLNNPAHQPIKLSEIADETDDVAVVGLVVGSQRLE